MALGRCAGCGFQGSVRAAQAHVSRCPAYAVLFRDAPERALDPVAEFRRALAENKPAPVVSRPRVSRPELSEAPVMVPEARPVPARQPGPVNVEYWQVPDSL